jgi:hypothetical protein
VCQIHQQCCKTALTTYGICCDHGVVDDCGVCGGDNSCDFVVEIALNISSSVGIADPVFDVTTATKYKWVQRIVVSRLCMHFVTGCHFLMPSFDVALKAWMATLYRASPTNFYVQRLYQPAGALRLSWASDCVKLRRAASGIVTMWLRCRAAVAFLSRAAARRQHNCARGIGVTN